MTVINNVPRDLLERAATSIEQRMCIQCEGVPCCMPESLNTLSDIRALLSVPSPAGVDGLEVVAYLIGGEPSLTPCQVRGVVNDPLCRLSDATAIIDGLRGEVGAQRVKTCAALKARNDAHEERDQQAQRVAELEQILRDLVPGCKWRFMRPRIDAALSAGKSE